ncbi:MAG: helix-turn-helix transcriptional regulator [Bacillaceae bacterium]|mgnify:FL=1|uniref:HTH cro/C1-type domain-containing protein n=1 Tax=Halalkalibacter akibai (strain ATCC 43226 / DSM 21942 / CIP 109018 / JCM 9157 / 1139) TaxID=1236973 RepID=W4QW68_HALA3|nr:helix-turn-helix transcriptional regulator [Halalkalibacter akibai]MDX5476167.1 helix-turn-helix transcriptional regulator [Bacillaceae bacterium]GAE35549.1 hypothetical protein JCM9157_2661 [Halalkalibacter akibai JCM 9157]
MIVFHLKNLLLDKEISFEDIAKDTKIPLEEILYLCSKHANKINFNTLNTLCHYLSVTTNELLSYEFLRIDQNTLNQKGEKLYGISAEAENLSSEILIKISNESNQLIIDIPNELYERVSAFSPNNISNLIVEKVIPLLEKRSINFDEFIIISTGAHKINHFYLRRC